MINLGMVRPGSTIRIPFDTFAAATGAPTALSNFAVGDILIYKDSSVTERASTTGYTATTTFDTLTGLNEIIIDLSSDATGDFFKAGSRYYVGISPVTADGQTMTFWAAVFEIGYPNAILNTSIATLASQTSFTLTAGPAEDDALNGLWCLVHDKASAVQLSWAHVLDYTGATKTVTLAAAPALTFTAAAIDNISFFAPSPMQSTVLGSKEVVQTGDGYAIVNSGTHGNAALKVLIDAIDDFLDTEVAAIKAKTDSLTFTVAGVVDANTLRVGGTVQTAGDLAAMITAVDDLVDTEVAAIKTVVDAIKVQTDKFVFTVANVVDANALRVGGTVQTGGDLAAMLTIIDDFLDTEVAAIKAKTDSLTFTVAGVVDANSLRVGGTVQTGGDLAAMLVVIDDFLDTEIAAIKAKTDALPAAIKKNTALAKFAFKMVDAADHVTPKTGLTVTCQRMIDGAAFANCNAVTATEVSAGWYYIDLAASDLNGNVIAFKATATGADQRDLLIVTQT